MEKRKTAENMKEDLKGKSRSKLIPLVCTLDLTGQLGFLTSTYPDAEVMKSQQFTERQGEGQSRNPADLTSFIGVDLHAWEMGLGEQERSSNTQSLIPNV